jgi:hypothetical protein
MITDIYGQLLSLILPKEIVKYFDLVNVEMRSIPEAQQMGVETGELFFYLDEKDVYRGAIEGHRYRPNGFYEPSRIRDFPLRDKRVTLIIRRRRWVDAATGESVGNRYSLTAEGTRHSVEFAAFLKECFGQIPDISMFS